jgi:hypothetical protein
LNKNRPTFKPHVPYYNSEAVVKEVSRRIYRLTGRYPGELPFPIRSMILFWLAHPGSCLRIDTLPRYWTVRVIPPKG